MLMLLSPAKTLDYEAPLPPAYAGRMSEPLFMPQAERLIAVLRKKTPRAVARLMDLSPALAELNVARYAAWTSEHHAGNSRPAMLAFAGDVYEGLMAHSLSGADAAWAQSHVVILSGLYGALRPLDALQPYRLEMSTALPTRKGRDLYTYWGDTVAKHLNERLAATHSADVPLAERVVVNLASLEYSRVALRKALNARVVQCQFEDFKGSDYKVISFFAKRARGLMARWAIVERVREVAELKRFNGDGYAFAAEASGDDRWVFRRRLPA